MRLEYNPEDPSRFVEFEWKGAEFRVPTAQTLSVAEGRELVVKARNNGAELAALMLEELVSRAGLTADDLDQMPRDMLVALYKAVIGETEKK